MNHDFQEKVITLGDMLFAVLYQWKKWLLAAVILGLAIGGFKGVSAWRTATDETVHAEQEQDYQSALVSYENTKNLLEHTIEQSGQGMKNQEEYLKNSVLMKLDYRNVYTTTVSLYISTDYQILPGMTYQSPDPTPTIAAAYQTALLDSHLWEGIAQQVNMETRFLRELVTVTQPKDIYTTLTVTVQHETAEKVTKIVELLVSQLYEVQKEVAASAGTHTLKTAVGAVGTTVDTTLATRQDTENELFNHYKEDLKKAKQELADLKEPTNTVVTTKSAIVDFVKWGTLGGIAGALVVILVLCVLFALSDKVYSATALETNFGFRCLGTLAAGEQKYSRLTRWLRKKEGRVEENTPESEALLASCVQQYCTPGKTLMISGGADASLIEAQADLLRRKLPDLQIVCAGSLLRDGAAMQQLAACDGVVLVEACGCSTYAKINRELAFIRDAGKTMIGFIAIENQTL